MDCLLNLLNDGHDTKSSSSSSCTASECNNFSSKESSCNKNDPNKSIGPCKLSGIRIDRRILSQEDLDDKVLNMYDYKHLCTIAAMTKRQMEDAEDLCTIAIVTKRGQTMTSSSNGSSFFILELGTFLSNGVGSLITMFLFNEAYSAFVNNKALSVGSVVAVVGPRVFPSKPGGCTAVSFSLKESDQMIIVGRAADLAVCSGNTPRGNRCKHLVDLRRSKYCKQHLKEKSDANISKMNKLKELHSFQSAPPNYLATQRLRQKQMANSSMQKLSLTELRKSSSSFGQTALVSKSLHRHDKKENSLRNKAKSSMQKSSLTEVRKSSSSFGQTVLVSKSSHRHHDKKETDLSNKTLAPGKPSSLSKSGSNEHMRNPYASSKQHYNPYKQRNVNPKSQHAKMIPKIGLKSCESVHKRVSTSCTQKESDTGDLLGVALTVKTAKSSKGNADRNQMKRRKLARFEGDNMNGQVYVPKPSSILFGNKTNSSKNNSITNSDRLQMAHELQQRKDEVVKERVLEQQQALAAGLQLHRSRRGNNLSKTCAGNKHTLASIKAKEALGSASDELFANITVSDMDKALTAKSKYAGAAEAEQLARSRIVVNDLERKEYISEKKQKKSKEEQKIKTIWHCSFCERKFSFYPKDCARSNHSLRRQRVIVNNRDSKNGIKNRKATNGNKENSLRLGSGLEWSSWKNSTYAN